MSAGDLVVGMFGGGAGLALLNFGFETVKSQVSKRNKDKADQAERPAKDMTVVTAGALQAVEAMSETVRALSTRVTDLQARAEDAERKLAEVTRDATTWLARAQTAEALLSEHGISFPGPDGEGYFG